MFGDLILAYISFAVLALLVLVYFGAFEYCRYATARRLADGLSGAAVYRLGGSYMRRDQAGVEERAWIVPDDKMAWGSLLSASRPSTARLLLQRGKAPGFRFHIEPKAGMLSGSVFFGALREAGFHARHLDESLRLRAKSPAEATAYFAAPEKQEALVALFRAGFTELKGDHGVMVATMKGVSSGDLGPEEIGRHLQHLRGV